MPKQLFWMFKGLFGVFKEFFYDQIIFAPKRGAERSGAERSETPAPLTTPLA